MAESISRAALSNSVSLARRRMEQDLIATSQTARQPSADRFCRVNEASESSWTAVIVNNLFRRHRFAAFR